MNTKQILGDTKELASLGKRVVLWLCFLSKGLFLLEIHAEISTETGHDV